MTWSSDAGGVMRRFGGSVRIPAYFGSVTTPLHSTGHMMGVASEYARCAKERAGTRGVRKSERYARCAKVGEGEWSDMTVK